MESIIYYNKTITIFLSTKVMKTIQSLIPIILLVGCGEKAQDTDAICPAPIAEAGADISISLGQAASLNGADSEFCDRYADQIAFTWDFVSIPSDSSINNSALSDNQSPTAITPAFIPDVVGEYVVSLQISDGENVSNEDFVVLSVQAGNAAPNADCGGAYSAEIGQLVTLDGSSSIDPEGQILSYEWSLSGPTCSALGSSDIYNGANVQPSFVPDCDGMFIISLVVNDGSQWSEPAICAVDVASQNRTPIADAGDSQNHGGCAQDTISLNAYGSYDLDGDPLTYRWSVLSVPADSTATDANFSSTTSPEAGFTWDVSGTYSFQLQVFDGVLWSAPDVVTHVIGNLEENIRPIANAGENQTVSVSASCDSGSSYSSATCSDCPETSFEISAAASIDPNGDVLQYTWTETTGTLEGIAGTLVSPSSAVTEVIIPPQAPDSVNSTLSFEFELEVEDCERDDTDDVIITYTCTGN